MKSMALPIDVDELLHGRVVESERLEFKEGWNPEAVLHTLCAFANDINNWGGGYIVIGVAEKDGLPVLPPSGLSRTEIAKAQKEILSLCHKIKPAYFPISEVEQVSGKDILIIWAPGGQHRPYKTPVNFTSKAEYAYYVRRFSSTKKANHTEERDLLALANNIPFDDRINHTKNLKDMSVSLIREYLNEIGSDLAGEALKMPFADLCLRMNIVDGPREHLKPKNIGLLLFNESPEKIFPGAHIDVVEFDDDAGDSFSEKSFSGPIHRQVKESLSYLKNKVIKEFVRKVPDRAEADRFFNYPYTALEEILVNAVYHRSYEDREPVEVRVYPDRILVVSYPGPMPPLNKNNINKPVVTPRRYRNRRIGDFLKELHLTEGRSTGFPKIRRALKKNGSSAPVYETDGDREYFMATIKIHPKAKEEKTATAEETAGQVGEQVSEQVGEQVRKVLEYCSQPRTKQAMLAALGLAPAYLNYKRHIYPLLQGGLLELTIPDKPNSRLQKYKLTARGRVLLNRKKSTDG